MALNFITSLADRIKSNRAVAFCLAALLLIIGWAAAPVLDPYARVPGNTLEFVLACVPDEFGIEFRSNDSRVLKAEISVDALDENSAVLKQIVAPADLRVVQSDNTSSSASMLLSDGTRKTLSADVRARVSTRVVVFLRKKPFTDVQQVELRRGSVGSNSLACKAHSYSGDELSELIPRDTGVQLLHINLIQERLSDYLLLFNSSVGNLILMVLCAVLLWAMWRVGDAALQRWKVREAKLQQVAEKVVNEATSRDAAILRDQLAAQYWHDCRWSNFWKVAGPAFGFLLTVSSLAASLHPSVQAARDAYAFVAGIQIAVISTFIGLLIRIFAHIDTSVRQNSLNRVAIGATNLLSESVTGASAGKQA